MEGAAPGPPGGTGPPHCRRSPDPGRLGRDRSPRPSDRVGAPARGARREAAGHRLRVGALGGRDRPPLTPALRLYAHQGRRDRDEPQRPSTAWSWPWHGSRTTRADGLQGRGGPPIAWRPRRSSWRSQRALPTALVRSLAGRDRGVEAGAVWASPAPRHPRRSWPRRTTRLVVRSRADALPWPGSATGLRFRSGTNLVESATAELGAGPSRPRAVGVRGRGRRGACLATRAGGARAGLRVGSAVAALWKGMLAVSSSAPPADGDVVSLVAVSDQGAGVAEAIPVEGTIRALASRASGERPPARGAGGEGSAVAPVADGPAPARAMKRRAATALALLLLVRAAPPLGAALGPRYGGRLAVGVLDVPASLAPADALGRDQALTLALVHETLIRVESDGSPSPASPCAGPAPRRDRMDPLDRTGLRFHDGAPLTSADAALDPALPAWPLRPRLRLRREPRRWPRVPRRIHRRAGRRLRPRPRSPPAPLPGGPGPSLRAAGRGGRGRHERPGGRRRALRAQPSRARPPAGSHPLRGPLGRAAVPGLPGRAGRGRSRGPDRRLRGGRLDVLPGGPGASRLASTLLLAIDPSRPPFDRREARDAVDAALERMEIVRLLPGADPARVILGPGLLPPLPGARRLALPTRLDADADLASSGTSAARSQRLRPCWRSWGFASAYPVEPATLLRRSACACSPGRPRSRKPRPARSRRPGRRACRCWRPSRLPDRPDADGASHATGPKRR
jgi:hypothetical protein